MIHWTVYRGGRAPEPIAQDDLTWAELADELEAMTRELPDVPATASLEEQKLHMLAFGPHRLREPYRKLANVEHVTLLTIDVDRVADVDALVTNVAALETNALVYESPSSTPDAARVRILAPVSRPIAVAECAATRFAFAEIVGLAPGCGVEGAKDAARIFFAGRYHGTPERRVWRFGE